MNEVFKNCPVCNKEFIRKNENNEHYTCSNDHDIMFVNNPDSILRICINCDSNLISYGANAFLYLCKSCGIFISVSYSDDNYTSESFEFINEIKRIRESNEKAFNNEFKVLIWNSKNIEEKLEEKFTNTCIFCVKRSFQVLNLLPAKTSDYGTLLDFDITFKTFDSGERIPTSLIKRKKIRESLYFLINEKMVKEFKNMIPEHNKFKTYIFNDGDLENCDLLTYMTDTVENLYIDKCLTKKEINEGMT